ncbi:MAG: cysteine hydrolase [Firmicutes bacterium]|nr:cysteine hydrolase [Bacillota bacterium]
MRKFLVVVDVQKDFIDGALGTAEAVSVVPRVVECIRAALEEDRALIFTQDTHQPDYMDTSEGRHLPVLHCVKDTEGWLLHEAVAPYAATTLQKPSFGAPALAELLGREAENGGANLDIALCGVCTDICVVTNALLLRAHLPEAALRVYKDACAGVTPARHEAALEVMRACQIEVV